MTPPLVHWHLTLDATNEEAYAILSQDPVWNCFALAGLEPPLRDYSQYGRDALLAPKWREDLSDDGMA